MLGDDLVTLLLPEPAQRLATPESPPVNSLTRAIARARSRTLGSLGSVPFSFSAQLSDQGLPILGSLAHPLLADEPPDVSSNNPVVRVCSRFRSCSFSQEFEGSLRQRRTPPHAGGHGSPPAGDIALARSCYLLPDSAIWTRINSSAEKSGRSRQSWTSSTRTPVV